MTQTSNYPIAAFRTTTDNLLRLSTVLQSGFFKNTTEGMLIVDFLSQLPGFTKDYIFNAIETIFFNGDAIDSLDTPIAGTESVLALSSAMPGLAGAILRKGSPHAALRKSVDSRPVISSGRPVTIRVKLFNTIAVKRGPELLQQGVLLQTRDLLTFLELRPRLVGAMEGLTVDDQVVASPDLLTILRRHEFITLKANQ